MVERIEEHRGQRVVVVGPDLLWHWLVQDAFADADVRSCPGPEFVRRCPLLAGRSCPLVEDADVVVTGLDSRQPVNAALAAALRTVHPGTRVVTRPLLPGRDEGPARM